MRNKILIGVVALLVVFFAISVRVIFNYQFTDFETEVKQFEAEQMAIFNKEKDIKMAQLLNDSLVVFVNQHYEEAKSVIEKDTTFSFLYLSGTVKYKMGRLDYYDCLREKCILEKQNAAAQEQITLKEQEMQMKFGNTFVVWYSKLRDEKIVQTKDRIGGCSSFYSELYEISYNINAWNEFETFLSQYDNEINMAQVQSEQAETQFLDNVKATKNSLSSSVINYFDTLLLREKYRILVSETESRIYMSPTLGVINYYISNTSFNQQAFQTVVNYAFEEQWKYNSLKNGSMPYSSCYGSNNSCNDWSSSQIKVKAGVDRDVLVSIKDYKGRVVRHGYIKAGNSFTFNIPDGRFQVFFYSGNGWNPNKQMPSSTCGYVQGGFVSNEEVTKDNYIELSTEIMTYELIQQKNGNFATKPSSLNEAF